jgi:hypothetical protein
MRLQALKGNVTAASAQWPDQFLLLQDLVGWIINLFVT